MSRQSIQMDSTRGRRSSSNHRRQDMNGVIPKNHKHVRNTEQVVRKLADTFQDVFDYDLIHSVAQTCEYDLGKSTEVLMVLSGTTQGPRSRRVNSLVGTSTSTRAKTKSLPSTLKSHHKISSGALSDCSTKSMPNGLRSEHDSVSSGQVWQRHYKSKPQSPGLLTMIPPAGKEPSSTSKLAALNSKLTAQCENATETKRTNATIITIEQLLKNNVKVCILMRGVPGAGKTHLAQYVVRLVSKNDFSQHIFSTDDYFVMLGRGNYAYDPALVSQAHHWNQKRVSEALRRATNPVIVDNTNTQAWEMRPYVTMAVQHGYLIEVLEPATTWKNKEAELARRNVHSVPREKIRQMLDRYEPGWTGEKLLNLFKLKYTHCGAAHVPQEIMGIGNSPLAQHRQHLEKPEKPKRKNNGESPKKKDRHTIPGIAINDHREKQLDELNKLFAEYGTHMDPVSRQKVLESGVPISEIVSRMRKLQGTVLPLPKQQKSEEKPKKPDYLRLAAHQANRESPTESVEPDTMSSSNVSETSDSESDEYADDDDDDDNELINKHMVGSNNDDQWEEDEVKSEGHGTEKPVRHQPFTSSQEELSILDYQISTPMCSSQDELSIIDYGLHSTQESPSSSSEEPKTEMIAEQKKLDSDIAPVNEDRLFRPIGKPDENEKKSPFPTIPEEGGVDINDSLMDMLRQKYEPPESISPDLETIPLPSIPETLPKLKPNKLETIAESPKALSKNEKSPEELLKNFDLNWASISIMSTWEQPPIVKPKPQRKPIFVKSTSTQTGNASSSGHDGTSRSVNDDSVPVPVRKSTESVPMFDKSSMTEEEDLVPDLSENLKTLQAIFPSVSEVHIKDLIAQCNGNVAWVAELLSDPGFTYHDVPELPNVPEIPDVPDLPELPPLIEPAIIGDGKKTIRRKKEKKIAEVSELQKLLKKEIENSIKINDDHYSDKTLFIKKLKSGEISMDEQPEEVAVTDGDAVDRGEESLGEEPMATVPLLLDASFLENLAAKFGGTPHDSFQDYKPLVHIPLDLAEQIYWHWVESVNEQVLNNQYHYEKMLKEDELLATALQEQEHEIRPRSFMDNVDEQLAESLSKINKERLSENRSETVASKLAQQILFDSYPHIDRNALLDIFRREGYSLTRTQEILASIYEVDKPTLAPEISFERSLLDTCPQVVGSSGEKPKIVVKKMTAKESKNDVLVVDPSAFRREIQQLQDRRLDYCHQGQEALRKKNFSTATYFFQTAQSLKEKIKQLQQSSISLKLFDEKPRNLAVTLDLHFLFVPEAVQVLDLFVDHHLRHMTGNKLDLFLITGRGQRSYGGKSKIKPIVKKRLEQRHINFVEDNPGMLRVTLSKNDALSSEL